MNEFSLPQIPTASDDNLLARLLVAHGTSDEMVWSLLPQVDLASRIDGKSLLQVFCEERGGGPGRQVRRPVLREGERFPASTDETWPALASLDPQQSSDTWLAAALIANDPDPFSWVSEGQDVLDFVVSWNNDCLFDQLMRKPGAPSSAQLNQRCAKTGSWLHTASAMGLAGCQMLETFISYGLNPDIRDHFRDKGTALHAASHATVVKLLIDAGADPLSTNASGKMAPQVWVERALDIGSRYVPNAAHIYDLPKLFDAWAKNLTQEQKSAAGKGVGTTCFRLLRRQHPRQAEALASGLGRHMMDMDAIVSNKQYPVALAMAKEYSRSKKRARTVQIMLEDASLASMERGRLRSIPSWGVLAMIAFGHIATVTRAEKNAHVDVLAQVVQMHVREGCTEEQACINVMETLCDAVDGKSFRSGSMETLRDGAFQELASQMANEISGSIPMSSWGRGFLAAPGLWPRLLNAHLDEPSARALVAVLPDMARQAATSGAPMALVAWSQASRLQWFHGLSSVAQMTLSTYISVGKELMDLDLEWSPSLPGAAEGLSALASLPEAARAARALGAEMEASWLEKKAPQVVGGVSRGTRL